MSNGLLHPVAIWLVPEPGQQRQLQEIIAGLARRFSSNNHFVPAFPPHVTLCAIPNLAHFTEDLPNLLNSVDDFCAEQEEIELELSAARPVSHRDKENAADTLHNGWSTFLFAAFETNQAALNVFGRAESAFPGFKAKRDPEDPDGKRLMPHLSLMYSYPANSHDIPREGLETNTTGFDCLLPGLPKRFCFAALQVVMPRSGNWADIMTSSEAKWDAIHTRQFAPATSFPRLRAVVAPQPKIRQ